MSAQTRQEKALEWAQKRAAEGHHHYCATQQTKPGNCDCYYSSGAYAAAEILLSLLVAELTAVRPEAGADA